MSAAPIPQGGMAAEIARMVQQLRNDANDEAADLIELLTDGGIAAEQDAIDRAAALAASEARAAELASLLNTPHTDDWFDGVRLEAGHQITRWGADHDAGKQPHDWFWLIGYLAGKALHAAMTGNSEKAKHHTISTGAALLNWFRAMTGDTNAMRPGIDTPKGEGETS